MLKDGRAISSNPLMPNNNNTITQYKGDDRKHFVWHCNGSCGCIFEASHDQCRVFVMHDKMLMQTCIITDENEHIQLKNMSEAAIRGYFAKLRLEASQR